MNRIKRAETDKNYKVNEKSLQVIIEELKERLKAKAYTIKK